VEPHRERTFSARNAENVGFNLRTRLSLYSDGTATPEYTDRPAWWGLPIRPVHSSVWRCRSCDDRDENRSRYSRRTWPLRDSVFDIDAPSREYTTGM